MMSLDQISQSYVINVYASSERTTLMIIILLGVFSNIFETMRLYLIGISTITLLSNVRKDIVFQIIKFQNKALHFKMSLSLPYIGFLQHCTKA